MEHPDRIRTWTKPPRQGRIPAGWWPWVAIIVITILMVLTLVYIGMGIALFDTLGQVAA